MRLDKDKKGLGFNEYSVVPPPPTQVYSPPKKDLSWMGLPEFVDDTVTDYSRPTPSVDVSKDVSASSLKQGGSFDNVVSKPMIRFVKETGCLSVSKDNNTENPRKSTVKYEEMYRNTSQSLKVRSNNFGPPIIEDSDSDDESEFEPTPNKTDRPSIKQVKMNQSTREIVEKKESSKQNKNHPRGNQRNWNNQKSQQLGKDFVMQNKACYNCGSLEHLKFYCKQNIWVDKGKTWSRVNHDNMKYPSKPTLNCAHSNMTSLVEPAHSHVKRPFVRKTAVKNKVWVLTVRTKFPTIGPKVPTAKPTVAANKGNRGKAVKASACWIWKPKQNQPDQGSNLNGVSGIPHDNIDDKGYWDSGCSRHMTGNISYLSEYEPYNRGYVSFGHGGGMITGKGTIKTGKLEFENVYFVKELKYNLFSVSQICDNKNSVLFTDSECLVLGKDFKLVDDTHVLLRTPRQQNMYSIDLKNIVPHKNLTCLIAKASEDENSDYGGANQDRKSTTRGCQFLGRRLISWQCKKQTIVATSTTEAEYVAAASGCGQVLWIQNQLLDYGYNFMNTKIYIDNNSAICIVKNPVYHSKTKHIEIRHHFIRDCYEKKLINVDHIHTDDNVADLLTKAFDVGRFQYLVVSIGMLDP
ncbi:hypothetical protein Tco_0270787 [Tanacetum coccineum]